jgi:hypothetical protein
MVTLKNLFVSLIFWTVAIIIFIWGAFTCVSAQKVTFPKDRQTVTAYLTRNKTDVSGIPWTWDQVGIRWYFSTGNIIENSDTVYVIQHSFLGDSCSFYAKIFWKTYPEVESVASNVVTPLFKTVIIPPVINYLSLPYAADWRDLKDESKWNTNGSAVSKIRPTEVVLFGPLMYPRVIGELIFRFNLERSGTYLVKVHTWGDNIVINGVELKLSDKDWEWAEKSFQFPVGANTLTMTNTKVWARIDSVRIEPFNLPGPPFNPFILEVK